MPPSPSIRCSPGRDPRAHKRGRSMEGLINLKQRDDDLALFNEVQTREKDNFLLQDDEDFEDIFPNKLRHFSDYKLGIHIPVRGESSDLLQGEEEKNDYEWLLTPPDTPLFASLDDEPPQVNFAQRGRTQTQPISISRSSTMEKSRRSSRGSASPNRVSISPRSHNSPFEVRGQQPSSTPSASPPTTFRPTAGPAATSPSRKSSSSVPRASSSVPRRLSTGSNGPTNSRGISPVKTTVRGNSASPKIRSWQSKSNILGFSTEVPPNLRTSLADRPASFVRGSSPAASRSSMSPTASRSICSSHSKGSVASSGDDEMESLSSSSVLVVGNSQSLNSRKVGGFQNHNKNLVSKKAIRAVSSSSSPAPKRSFDLALRQMDHKKGPQNMFRPLLSSVPSSTFHGGTTSSGHHHSHTMISRNSSVTTSSNASSGLGLSGTHDPEVGPDDDATSNVQDFDDGDDDEVFLIDKDDNLNESRNLGNSDPAISVDFDGILDMNSEKGMLICSRCGNGYSPTGLERTNLCADCVEESYSPLTFVDRTVVDPQTALVKSGSGQHDDLVTDGEEPVRNVPEEHESKVDFLSPKVGYDLVNDEAVQNVPLESYLSRSEEHGSKVDFSTPKAGPTESGGGTAAAGISILLKRSSSIKGAAVLRNTNFSAAASSISYDDLSYMRESTNSMRSFVSVSSSSVDCGPRASRHTDTRFQRQSSGGTRSETENSRHHRRTGSSVSGTSSHVFHASSHDDFGRDVQENMEDYKDTCFDDNNDLDESRVEFGESLLTDSLEVEELAGTAGESLLTDSLEVEELVGPADTNGLQTVENPDVSPASKCEVSLSSMSSIEEEELQEDHDTSNHENKATEETIVLVGPEKGAKRGRSLTLEEVTDTILFCSSIVHDLAHKAAFIAVENETESNENKSWPLIPTTPKTSLQNMNTSTKQSSKSPSSKSKQRKETLTEKESLEGSRTTEPESKTDHQPKTRMVGVRDSNNGGDSKKPPMLESKCNCTIM